MRPNKYDVSINFWNILFIFFKVIIKGQYLSNDIKYNLDKC